LLPFIFFSLKLRQALLDFLLEINRFYHGTKWFFDK
jgi:hypothetical protein